MIMSDLRAELARSVRCLSSMRQFVIALTLALSVAPTALAQDAADDPAPEKMKSPRVPQVKTNPRIQCGCPQARLLARGAQVLDDDGTVSAWLHDGARLEPFRQDDVNKQKLHPTEAPLIIEEFAGFGDHMPVATTSRLVRARATGELAPATYLGVMRKNDPAPRDVLAVSGKGGSASPAPSDAPSLRAMWLAPLEERDRAGCGTFVTHRLAFEMMDGSAPASSAGGSANVIGAPEAFLVKDKRTDATALVDARYAGAFGLGRVDVCEQGVAFAPGEGTEIEVRPVSVTFGIGEPWTFSSDGTGMTDLTRVSSPKTADLARIAEAFPIPGVEDLRGPTYKEIAIFVMGGGVGGAALIAFVIFVVIPARKRRMKDFPCPSCARAIPIDTLDPKTDGFFCPSCGASGFWKGKSGEIEAKALPK